MEDKKKTAKSAQPVKPPSFAGRVLGITAGGSDAPWRFNLASKKGERRSFVLEAGDSTRFGAMSALVTSAYLAGKKLHVRGAANGGTAQIAAEVRVGAKEKTPKPPKAKPEKRATAEAPAPSP